MLSTHHVWRRNPSPLPPQRRISGMKLTFDKKVNLIGAVEVSFSAPESSPHTSPKTSRPNPPGSLAGRLERSRSFGDSVANVDNIVQQGYRTWQIFDLDRHTETIIPEKPWFASTVTVCPHTAIQGSIEDSIPLISPLHGYMTSLRLIRRRNNYSALTNQKPSQVQVVVLIVVLVDVKT